MVDRKKDPEFPCSLVITTPFPTYRLAESALRTLQVDEELSPLVRRSFSLVAPVKAAPRPDGPRPTSTFPAPAGDVVPPSGGNKTILRTEYRAKSNRMLRVAVNGFMESLGVVLGVMERLDVDVLGKA